MKRNRQVSGLFLLLIPVLFMGCSTSRNAEMSDGLYKSTEKKAAAFKSYDRVMGLWEHEYTEDWIENEFGTTHIIVSGPRQGKPIFLLPGLFADATMWYANAGALAQDYRIYAVDLPVFGGKSEPSDRSINDIEGYTAWFLQLLDHYGYKKTAVAGLSYGSWLSLALAREIPQVIEAAVMLDPSETFMKMSGIMAWKGFAYFMFFPDRDKYREFFTWISGGFSDSRSEIWLEHMIDVIEYGTVGMMDVPQHRMYEPEELSMVRMPVLILAGGKPIIYKNPEDFVRSAEKALPQAEIELIQDTGHSLNVEKPDEVNRRILKFLQENYR